MANYSTHRDRDGNPIGIRMSLEPQVTCSECKGMGEFGAINANECPRCRGTGSVEVESVKEFKEKVEEVMSDRDKTTLIAHDVSTYDIIFDPVYFMRAVELIDEHLDENVSQEYKDQPLAQDWARVSKAFEEGGESIDALIGYTGQNPRKGKYGSKEDMLKELADTALTAIYAIQHFTKDNHETMKIIYDMALHHAERMDIEIREPRA